MSVKSANVARFLSESSLRQPHFCAVKAPVGRMPDGRIRYESLCFAELEFQANATARLLQAAGLQRGMRTLLMVRPGLDLIRITFALFKMGAVPVVIDPGMGLSHFLQCVERTRPQALVGIPLAHMISRVFRKSFRDVHHRVRVGKTFAQSVSLFESPQPFATVESDAVETAAILFTSGSTGAPKGVVYEHGQFDAQVRMIRDGFSIEPGEVDLPMLPIFALYNPALGMTTVVPEINPSRPATADPAKIVQAILQNEVTNSFGSPVLWGKILRHLEKTGQQLPGMRRVLMAGAAVPPELMQRLQPYLPNATLWSPYGATECLPLSAVNADMVLGQTRSLTEGGAGTCVGTVFPGMQLRVIAVDDGPLFSMSRVRELPQGQIGEIIVSGPVVTKSYDALPEATAAAKIYDEEGSIWHRMGDLGYVDVQGRIWFCGRKVERVETEQGTLYTDCCEAVFNRHPGVYRSALIGLGVAPHQTPAMVIEPDPGHSVPTPAELLHIARSHAHTAQIETFFFHRKFPVDVRHNAKIHRLALARRFRR